MKRLRLPLWLTLVCMLVPLVAAPAPAGAASRGERMVDTVNWWRAEAGLRPLRESRRLHRSAAARSDLMMRYDFFSHPSRLRVRGFDRVGEVLERHRSHRPRVKRTLRRWARSPAHRRVLLSRKYRRIGAARATGRFHGRRTTIWVVRLGRK